MPNGHDPRGSVQGRAVVVPFAQFGRPGVQANTHKQRVRVHRGSAHRQLGSDGTRDCVAGTGEDGVDTVSGRLDHVALIVRDGVSEDLVVVRQRPRHPVGVPLPVLRRPLDVREEKGDRP